MQGAREGWSAREVENAGCCADLVVALDVAVLPWHRADVADDRVPFLHEEKAVNEAYEQDQQPEKEEASRHTCLTLTRIELSVGRMTVGPLPAPALTTLAPCACPAPAPPPPGCTTLAPPPAPACTGPPVAAGCFPRCTADCPPAGVPWRGVLVEKAPGVDGRADEDEEAVTDDADTAGGFDGPGCALMAACGPH